MPKLSLTDFVDVVTRSGAAKITKIAQIKNRPSYSPQSDFYKAVRECIIEMHEKGLPKSHLADMLGKIEGRQEDHQLSGYCHRIHKVVGKKGTRMVQAAT